MWTLSLAALISSMEIENEADLSATRHQRFGENADGVNSQSPPTDIVDIRSTSSNIWVEDIIITSPPISPNPLPETSSRKRRSINPAENTGSRVVAERKRREQLSERFISLASLIPNLKKMDKSSILEDAIKYMKEIEASVKSLECILEKVSEEDRVVESSVEEKQDGRKMEMEMDVQESNKKNILIRILCEDRKDAASKLLSQLKTLQLTILSSCFLPFGQRALDITILAKKMEDSNVVISTQEVEQKLSQALLL